MRANSRPSVVVALLIAGGLALGCGDESGQLSAPTRRILAVAPTQLVIPSGDAYRIIVEASDDKGAALPATALTWISSAPTIARVSPDGLVTTFAPGHATISVANGPLRDTVAVTVIGGGIRQVDVGPPQATVEVGNSQLFSATARDAAGVVVPTGAIAWSTEDPGIATVDQAGRVTGVAPGATGVLAQAGGITGRGVITVVPEGGPPVASVQVTPSAVSLSPGGTGNFSALPRDAGGTPLTGLPVDWRIVDPAVARVDQNGVVTALADGFTHLVATVDGISGQAAINVSSSSPHPGAWPNEPAGFQTVTDQPWDLLSTLGWIVQFGTADLALDLAAPASPPTVLDISYPVGFGGGSAPGTMARGLPAARRYFFGTWWKVSDPWDGHESNVNKVLFFFPTSGGDMTLVMYGPSQGPFQLRVIPQFPGQPSEWLLPNVRQRPVTLGTWHRIEWLIDYSAQDGTGAVRWWLDGELIGDHVGVPFPSGPGDTFKISPTWGGLGDSKATNDHFWFDHTYVSYQP